MASSSQKRNRTHKGKSPAEDVVVPPQPATRIEQVLDYSRYFSTRRQMVLFEKKFHARPVLPPKVMHTPFFAAPGFEFQKSFELARFTTFPWNYSSVL